MTPSAAPANRQRDLFLAALEKGSERERSAFLDQACGSDKALRESIELLLREHGQVGDFLEEPALAGREKWTPADPGPNDTRVMTDGLDQAGERIGRYKLLQKIGEGGCGVVYMAEQEEPVRRRVALKIIKLGMDTRSVIARFEAERQALAMMDHPNIARVLDAGATENGRPYFVMELVRGVRITEYCDQNNLRTEERLKLFVQVCHAIQHAHQKGIIHRDIKPSNMLVTLHDGVPVPKVIDFGIAKATEQRLTEKTLFTEFAAFIGTPAYMSPEQAEMSGLDVDTRSDIYSLGVLLYELLIGKTPFDAESLLKSGLDECRKTIRHSEPMRPSTRLSTMLGEDLTTTAQQRHTEGPRLIHMLRGELDWIAMKCLEKDRTRRYATASDLAEEVQRYLDGDPVLARPPSNVYRLKKLLQRHQGVFAAAALVTLTLIVGVAVSTWQAVRATTAEHKTEGARKQEVVLRRQAEEERGAAQLNEYVADINLAQESLKDGNYGRAVQLLLKHEPKAGEPDLRGFEWRYLWQQSRGDEHVSFPTQEGSIQSMAFSPAGDLLVLGMREKLAVWDVRTRSLIRTLPKSNVVSLVFFPDGKRLITASGGSVRIWKTTDWTEEIQVPQGAGPVTLSRDGTRLAVDGRQFMPMNRDRMERVRVWDTATWQEMRTLPGASGPMAFSPDGKTLATDGRNGITLWTLDGSKPELVLENSTNVLVHAGPWSAFDRVMAFSPDGKSLVAARNVVSDRGVFVLSIWDAETGDELSTLPNDPEHIEHTGVISALAFSPDGRILATSSADHSIRLWDLPNRQRIETLQGHLTEVTTLAFSPDGKNVCSAGKDGGVKFWKLKREQKEDVLAGPWEPLGFSRDGRSLMVMNHRQAAVTIFDANTLEEQQKLPIDAPRFRPPNWLAYNQGSHTLAYLLENGVVNFFNTETRSNRSVRLTGARRLDGSILGLSPDGQAVITRSWDAPGRWWNLSWWNLSDSNQPPKTLEAQRVLFSPDGRTLAAFTRTNGIAIWDVTSQKLRTNLVVDPAPGMAAGFSPDGRILALGARNDDVENAVRLLEVQSGKLIGSCLGHKQGIVSVCFSPDGRTLASAGDDSTLRLWNVSSQQELLTIRQLGGTLNALMFSPDGQMLVGSTSFSRRAAGIRFFRAPQLKENDLVEINTSSALRPSGMISGY